MIRLGHTLGVKIRPHFAENIVIPGFLKVSHHHRLGIGLSLRPRKPQLVGCPKTKQLIAAGSSLELQRFVMGKLRFKPIPALIKRAHHRFSIDLIGKFQFTLPPQRALRLLQINPRGRIFCHKAAANGVWIEVRMTVACGCPHQMAWSSVAPSRHRFRPCDFVMRKWTMNTRRTRIYEGKAKILYEGPEPGTLIVHYKDDTTAFNAQKMEVIDGKGVLNNRISELIFTRLNEMSIPTHFIRRMNMREQLIREVEIIPVEVVIRNVAAGSLAKRLGLEEGTALPRSIVEFYYKNDALNDPMVSEEHITAFGWANPQELDDIMALSIRINDFLCGLFLGIGIKLVDFKIEFGRLYEGEMMRVVLADEISPDSCRLWDLKTNEKLDKDRFRRDMGGVVEAYQEVARRLGIIMDSETPERSKPKLVKTD